MNNEKKKFIIITIMLLLILPLMGCGNKSNKQTDSPQSKLDQTDKIKLTVYKSPNCGCCSGHIAELKKQGFEVKTVIETQIDKIKRQYNIPKEMQSCHTIVAGDYFIEGHVPIEAINKLLKEKPEIDGIALPRMPSGSPGMPGKKKAPFKIFQLKDGNYSEFMTI